MLIAVFLNHRIPGFDQNNELTGIVCWHEDAGQIVEMLSGDLEIVYVGF